MTTPFDCLGPFDFDGLRKRTLEPVDVAVIDSGVDATHSDLTGRIASAWQAKRVDSVMTVAPMPTGLNQDEHGHGTAVAGIVAAIAPHARIHDYRIFAVGETSSGDGLAACLEAAISQRPRIINMSLAVRATYLEKMARLLEQAYRQGILVVAAQRNIPNPDLGLPAELSYSLGVNLHSETSAWQLLYRAHHPIPISARGENVRAPAPGGGYTDVTGTSFATPTVSGLAALLLGAYPDLEPFEIKTLLKNHARYPRLGQAAVSTPS